MPLLKLEKINQNSSWALWKIDEPFEELVQYLQFHPDDLTELHSIHHPRKQLEWLSGRAALRTLLDTENQAEFRISKDDKGKPFLHDQIYQISLANSFPYGVAIIHRNLPVGIDIEKPSPKLLRVRHKFLSDAEAQVAQEDLHQLCKYWATKESLYKLYGRKQLSLKQNIIVKPNSTFSGNSLSADVILEDQAHPYQLNTFFWDGFYIVYSHLE
ncbi:MAG: 4'-phosphopantetheinyl transferase family protein [Cyclobacteriaceae bacterium]